MTVLAPGTPVQYRKVGRAVILSHTCIAEYDCAGQGSAGAHRYAIRYHTGRRQRTRAEVWLTAADRLPVNLTEFAACNANDGVKRDLELIHVPCGTYLCDVEHGDGLQLLADVAAGHIADGCRR